MTEPAAPQAQKDQIILRGIDSPERLLAWFRDRHHQKLVLRVADIFELAPIDQDGLAEILVKAGREPPAAGQPVRAWYQALGVMGYIVTPIASLLSSLSMEDIARLQEIIGYYMEGRRSKGEPSRDEPCDCTEKGTRPPQAGCRLCDGGGVLHILLEVTDEELRLAGA